MSSSAMMASRITPDQIESMGKVFTARTPVGSQGTADNFTSMVLYLVSDTSRCITGESIMVDSGYLLS